MATIESSRKINLPGVYRHPETGATLTAGSVPIADGLVQVGFVYEGKAEKPKAEKPKTSKKNN